MDQDTFYRLTALDTTRLVDARQEATDKAVRSAHSCELVATLNGVDYVNDSRSTFLDATLQNIAVMDRRVIWIAGHRGVEHARGALLEMLRERVSAIILFDKAAQRNPELMEAFDDQAYAAEDLRHAVFLARELARSGDMVFFSPACPSGDGFANYEERGAEFKRAVRDL